MSNVARGIWDNTYGLLVDDGQLAVGAILALAITWLIAQTSVGELRDNAGWVLLGLVVVLVFANLYRAGRNALRRTR
jgi:hypothetical protein